MLLGLIATYDVFEYIEKEKIAKKLCRLIATYDVFESTINV